MKKMLFLLTWVMVMTAACAAWAQNPSDRPYKWTGLYFGFQGSYHNGNSEWDRHHGWGRSDHDVNGGMGGFFVGYNYQTPVKFVVGIETEMNFGKVDGSGFCADPNYHCNTDVGWIGSTRGRFGYAFDRFMPYVTIGLAYAGADTYMRNLTTGREYGDDTGYSGFTSGVGFEFAITRNILIRADYSFYYFFESDEDHDYNHTDVQIDNSAFKVGVGFKF